MKNFIYLRAPISIFIREVVCLIQWNGQTRNWEFLLRKKIRRPRFSKHVDYISAVKENTLCSTLWHIVVARCPFDLLCATDPLWHPQPDVVPFLLLTCIDIKTNLCWNKKRSCNSERKGYHNLTGKPWINLPLGGNTFKPRWCRTLHRLSPTVDEPSSSIFPTFTLGDVMLYVWENFLNWKADRTWCHLPTLWH